MPAKAKPAKKAVVPIDRTHPDDPKITRPNKDHLELRLQIAERIKNVVDQLNISADELDTTSWGEIDFEKPEYCSWMLAKKQIEQAQETLWELKEDLGYWALILAIAPRDWA